MIAYIIALTPDDETYERISKVKTKIHEIFGEQKYLLDPPHTTLYVSLAENLDEIEKNLEKVISSTKKISVQIQEEFLEFEEDKLAGGGTSLGLKFDEEAKQKIINLQKNVVNALNSLRKDQIHPRYKNVKLPINMMESIHKYGFPFVEGNDCKPILIPHIGFCCFNPSENANKFKKEYPASRFTGEIKFSKISLYKLYEDDRTELIKDFNLE